MVGSLAYALVFAVVAKASPLNDVKAPPLPWTDLIENTGYQEMSASELAAHVKAAGWLLEPPEIDHDFLNFTPPSVEDLALAKRQNCGGGVEIFLDHPITFLDWDVQMSPVLCADDAPMTVTLTQGWSVSNTLTVSGSLSPTFIEDRLTGVVGVDYSRTWTSTSTLAITGTVKKGNCGCMIWRPTTTRRYGRVLRGCIGEQTEVARFMADSRQAQSYGGLSWVAGIRRVCQKPVSGALSRCNGGGYFV